MVYSNKFVMCILLGDKIQKELNNGTIPIPFGSEYTIRFRNKNNKRAVVKFSIDGENVSGGGYVIPPNSFIDIKRHHHTDKAFKFVALDSPDAIDYGKNGDNQDKSKGLIEAKFYLEKESNYIFKNYTNTLDDTKYWYTSTYDYNTLSVTNDNYYNNKNAPYTVSYNKDTISLTSDCINKINKSLYDKRSIHKGPKNEDLNDGVTVEGNKTGQNFTNVYIDLESDYVHLKAFLQGYENYTNDMENESLVLSDLEKQNLELKEEIKKEKDRLKMKSLIEENNLLKKELEEMKKRSGE